ncbi:response regulator transcription factor [Gracilibacillus kekensis]|uniref:Two-component system, response regulator YesN n=1 Tax=Gracilibacillus kekensis TaxID=1027249 RepID=A0A1M7N567_9BACI|nr:response regulator transcription factor [Gracilibacillus kekensis]SHM98546.1 two-component system, response regulator YesN [Gracilibacillus kekensis]
MLKVLIIDDEPLIREGLASVIDWNSYGFEIAGIAENGKMGLKSIRSFQPDVVFVDIRMPGLNGIEMVKQAKQEGFTCKFIVLSGYSNFAYAQQSIRLGMESYLLKPVDEEELISLIQSIRHKCLKEQLLSTQKSEYESFSEKEEWIKYITGQSFDHKSLKQYEDKWFHLASLTFYKNYDKSLIEKKLKLLGRMVFQWFWSDQTLYLLLNKINVDLLKKQLLHFSMEIKQPHQIQLLQEVKTTDELPQAYNDLQSLITQSYSYGNQLILSETDLAQKSLLEMDMNDWITDVCRSIEFENTLQLDGYFKQLETYYQSHKFEKQRVITEVIELTKDIYQKLIQNNQDISPPTNEEMATIVCEAQNLQSLLEATRMRLSNTANEINGFVCNAENTIEKIVEYVEKYYYKELSIKVIADLFNYNRSYLGKKFKKQTGSYFHHFLDNVRMENAKQLLLENGWKVYEVSEKVGYTNYDYFYKKFKKYTGVSPKKFQKYKRIQHT